MYIILRGFKTLVGFQYEIHMCVEKILKSKIVNPPLGEVSDFVK